MFFFQVDIAGNAILDATVWSAHAICNKQEYCWRYLFPAGLLLLHQLHHGRPTRSVSGSLFLLSKFRGIYIILLAILFSYDPVNVLVKKP